MYPYDLYHSNAPDQAGLAALLGLMAMIGIIVVPFLAFGISGDNLAETTITIKEFRVTEVTPDGFSQPTNGIIIDTRGNTYLTDAGCTWWLTTYFDTHAINSDQKFFISGFTNTKAGKWKVVYIDIDRIRHPDFTNGDIAYVRSLP